MAQCRAAFFRGSRGRLFALTWFLSRGHSHSYDFTRHRSDVGQSCIHSSSRWLALPHCCFVLLYRTRLLARLVGSSCRCLETCCLGICHCWLDRISHGNWHGRETAHRAAVVCARGQWIDHRMFVCKAPPFLLRLRSVDCAFNYDYPSRK